MTTEHVVQFYGSDRSLATTVAGFLAEGLVAGQPAIVIATSAHCVAIIAALRERLIDCDRAVANGDLTLLDAPATLDLLLDGDTPNLGLFEKHVGRMLEQITNGGRKTFRAYGEMVDVLWKSGRSEAALKLEILWNRLALKYEFKLLCGYAMGGFYKQPGEFEEVIAQHTRVICNDTSVVPFVANRGRPPRA